MSGGEQRAMEWNGTNAMEQMQWKEHATAGSRLYTGLSAYDIRHTNKNNRTICHFFGRESDAVLLRRHAIQTSRLRSPAGIMPVLVHAATAAKSIHGATDQARRRWIPCRSPDVAAPDSAAEYLSFDYATARSIVAFRRSAAYRACAIRSQRAGKARRRNDELGTALERSQADNVRVGHVA